MATVQEIEAEIARRQGMVEPPVASVVPPEQRQAIDGEVGRRQAIDAEIARRQAVERQVAPAQPISDTGQAILDIPGGAAVSELASAINRGTINLIDMVGPDVINNALAVIGSEKRVPTLGEQDIVKQATTGEFMEPGLAREAVRTGGEFVGPAAGVGAGLRTMAKALPKFAAPTTGRGIIQSLGSSTARQDVVGALAAGAGAEAGRELGGETGALVGAFMSPVAAAGTVKALTGILSAGKQGIQALMTPLANVSDDAASTLLAEAMVREGLTPKQITSRLKELGPEGLPADVGNTFARLLRVASNKIPRIEGRAADVFKARHAGQGERILQSIDDATQTGKMTVDDAIERLNTEAGPEIKRLYDEAGKGSIQLSQRVQSLLEGKSSVGRASRKAQQRLLDKRAAGDKISNIDVIDATKQELDDQIQVAIRAGNNNKARDLVRLKNVLVSEADASVPAYKQARNLFAGRATLENAADAGSLFIKMKPRDVSELTRTYGKSELAFYKLGAKRAILDKIDDLQSNADSVRRLFGKNGDVKKLRSLFNNDKAFREFSDTLKREADFVMTRRAAQANSTTAKQLSDDESALEALGEAANVVANPVGAANFVTRIVSSFGKGRQDKVFIQALEDVGDILLTKGIDPKKIESLLRKGTKKQIMAQLKNAIKKPPVSPYSTPSLVSGAVELQQEQQ